MQQLGSRWFPAALICALLLVGCGPSETDVDPDVAKMAIDPVDASLIPPAPTLSPTESLSDLELESGFSVELVAAEPDIEDPVALTFDGNGAMWVVEMRGYMPDEEGNGEDQPVGRIVVLEDTDWDGSVDKRHVFLDGLVLPRAISLVRGGVLVAEPPNLWFVENNNYQPGERTLVDSTYAVDGNVEHQPNTLLWARDNWIYSAKSDKRYRQTATGWDVEPTEFRGQWGMSQDDLGRLYYNHNGGVLQADDLLPNMLTRNPHHTMLAGDVYGAPRAPNFMYPRRITPGVNRAYRDGVLDENGKLVEATATCGPVVYRGDQFPEEYYGNVFVPEPAAQLVKRIVIREEHGVLSGVFPYENAEFLTGTDERFRPVNAYTAPDGSLYFVDMYRGLIQHSTYLTDYLKRQVRQRDLAKPVGMGRIYRVRYTEKALGDRPNMLDEPAERLVEHLSHPNGWWRDTAQRLLVQLGDDRIAPSVRALIQKSSGEESVISALWVLDGLGALTLADLISAARTSHTNVVRTTAVLAGRFARSGESTAALQFLRDQIDWNDRASVQWSVPALGSFVSENKSQVFPLFERAMRLDPKNGRLIDAVLGAVEDMESDLEAYFQSRAVPLENPVFSALQIAGTNARTLPAHESIFLETAFRASFDDGQTLFRAYCATCHGSDGQGRPGQAPSLISSRWVLQEPETFARILLDGLEGPISTDGVVFEASGLAMPGLRGNPEFSDADLAAIMTYTRNAWTNRASGVTEEDIANIRSQTAGRQRPYTASELEDIQPGEWQNLIPNDGSFTGWRQLGGQADYRIQDGQIVGTTVLDTPNSFLVTERHYGDFILELEFKVDSLLNSGVQIRSNSYAGYNNGVVHGYQIEIDPSPRAWSAGIYEESARGWLFDLVGKPAAQRAFRQNQWNHYRIEAQGPHLRTWINGVLAADLVDHRTLAGFVGLQVHGIGTARDRVGLEVRWRNIRIRDSGTPTLSGSINAPENPITAAHDQNPDTFWLGMENESWLEWDLRSRRVVSEASISFAGPESQTYHFKLIGSTDGKNWKRLFQGKQKGGSGHPSISFEEGEYRFIRFIGFCNDQNRRNDVTEFSIPGS